MCRVLFSLIGNYGEETFILWGKLVQGNILGKGKSPGIEFQ